MQSSVSSVTFNMQRLTADEKKMLADLSSKITQRVLNENRPGSLDLHSYVPPFDLDITGPPPPTTIQFTSEFAAAAMKASELLLSISAQLEHLRYLQALRYCGGLKSKEEEIAYLKQSRNSAAKEADHVWVTAKHLQNALLTNCFQRAEGVDPALEKDWSAIWKARGPLTAANLDSTEFRQQLAKTANALAEERAKRRVAVCSAIEGVTNCPKQTKAPSPTEMFGTPTGPDPVPARPVKYYGKVPSWLNALSGSSYPPPPTEIVDALMHSIECAKKRGMPLTERQKCKAHQEAHQEAHEATASMHQPVSTSKGDSNSVACAGIIDDGTTIEIVDEVSSPCPQGHHKLDGDCDFFYCRCDCEHCMAQKQKRGR